MMAETRLNLCVSLWNYLYHAGPESLDMVLCDVASNGFGVEWWPAIYTFDPYRPAYHPSFPRAEGYKEIRDLFKPEHRQWLRGAMHGMQSGWHSRAFDDDPKDYGTFEAYQEEIDTAAYLGSEAISVHYIGEHVTTCGFARKDIELVRKVLDYAESKGVKIALETRDFDSLKQAIDEFPDLGVCLDPACIRDNSSHSLQEFIDATVDRICFLHLYDSRENTGHLTPGTGTIPKEEWLYMLDALEDADFHGLAILEIHPPPEKAGQTPIEAAVEARGFFDRLA